MRVFSFSLNCFELTSVTIINKIPTYVKNPCGLFISGCWISTYLFPNTE